MSEPLVSVIMPLYNAEPYVGAAVESVLTQSHENLELVVVDDGSTDAGVNAVRSVADDRVRIVAQENAGVAVARNRGLDEALGDFVAWLDADDLCLPDRIATMLRAVEQAGAGFAHCDMLLIDGDDRPLGLWQSMQVAPEDVLPFLLRVGTPYNNPTILARKNVLTGCRHEPGLRIGEDTDFVSQFAPRHPGVHVPEPLVLYRRHAASATASGGPEVGLPQMELLLRRHELLLLVPEAWYGRDGAEAEALACALVGLRLSRRGFLGAALQWLERGLAKQPTGGTAFTVSAVASLTAGDLGSAAAALQNCLDNDPVAVNYHGELLATGGDLTAACERFRQALLLAPDYREPSANLVGLGGRTGLNLVNPDWRRFAG